MPSYFINYEASNESPADLRAVEETINQTFGSKRKIMPTTWIVVSNLKAPEILQEIAANFNMDPATITSPADGESVTMADAERVWIVTEVPS
jgi:Mg2+ and Co2+ transporter CorA